MVKLGKIIENETKLKKAAAAAAAARAATIMISTMFRISMMIVSIIGEKISQNPGNTETESARELSNDITKRMDYYRKFQKNDDAAEKAADEAEAALEIAMNSVVSVDKIATISIDKAYRKALKQLSSEEYDYLRQSYPEELESLAGRKRKRLERFK